MSEICNLPSSPLVVPEGTTVVPAAALKQVPTAFPLLQEFLKHVKAMLDFPYGEHDPFRQTGFQLARHVVSCVRGVERMTSEAEGLRVRRAREVLMETVVTNQIHVASWRARLRERAQVAVKGSREVLEENEKACGTIFGEVDSTRALLEQNTTRARKVLSDDQRTTEFGSESEKVRARWAARRFMAVSARCGGAGDGIG
jgi:hypothetical protein